MFIRCGSQAPSSLAFPFPFSRAKELQPASKFSFSLFDPESFLALFEDGELSEESVESGDDRLAGSLLAGLVGVDSFEDISMISRLESVATADLGLLNPGVEKDARPLAPLRTVRVLGRGFPSELMGLPVRFLGVDAAGAGLNLDGFMNNTSVQ